MFKNNSKENIFLSSAKELKKVQALSVCAMFAALSLILNQVASITIGPYIKIGFSGIPNQLADYLFGPVTGGLFAGILDVVKYFMKPDGPFFFGFTFNAMLSGLIYGTLLYRRPVSIKRIVIAEFLVKLVINCGLNTLWISMLYGKGFIALLGPRVIKNVIMLPIDSFILFFALTYAKKIAAQFGFFTVKSGAKERA